MKYKTWCDLLQFHFRFEILSFYIFCCHQNEVIEWPTPSQLAQILCHMERNLAKHVGPEEFLQCSASVIKENRLQTNQDNYVNTSMISTNTPLGVQDPKKTCNLESYLAWSARLRLLVANEILQVGLKDSRQTFPWTAVFSHTQVPAFEWSKQKTGVVVWCSPILPVGRQLQQCYDNPGGFGRSVHLSITSNCEKITMNVHCIHRPMGSMLLS